MAEERRKPGRPPGSKNKSTSEKSTNNTSKSTKSSSAKSSSAKSTSSSASKSDKNAEKAKRKRTEAKVGSRVRDEICAIIIMAVGAFLIVALQTDKAGACGEILHNFFLGCFGFVGYALPYYLVVYGILLFLNQAAHITGKSALFNAIIFLMIALINSARFIDVEAFKFNAEYLIAIFKGGISLKNGGLIGMMIGTLIVKAIGKPGLYIFASVVIIIFLLLVLNTPVSQFIEKMKIRKIEKQIEREEAYLEAQKVAAEEAERLAKEKENASLTLEKTRLKVSEFEAHAQKKAESTAKKEKHDDINVNIAGISEDDEPEMTISTYIPGRMSEGQKNIMNLMKADNLFENENNEQNEIRYGLDEISEVKMGYGLDDSMQRKGIGLDYNVKFSGDMTEEADEPQESSDYTAKDEEKALHEKQISFVTNVSANAVKNTDGHAAYEVEQKLSKKEARDAMLTQEELNLSTEPREKPYEFPPITLLNKPEGVKKQGNGTELKSKAKKLEETLRSFNVDARVVNVTQGPSVTQYEVQPAVGVKVASIVKLTDDIALNLQAKNIRIEAPIPGKAAVGIEVENDIRSMVTLREVLSSQNFKNAKSKISFALGRDIYGNDIVGDIAEMPHLLVAGSTGSGKSVCINSIILSILYKAKPEEVKLVLVDPKAVELGNYNGIPHLLIPVVTKPEKAAAALNWAVAEMTERYNKFAEVNERKLSDYNNKMRSLGQEENVMPQIVIIIDELADLMMAAPSQVEESITRLAQMARAAGMHIIVATQRPSVDVVTGLIKANIPSRIAFKVASQVDSRTILNSAGAEKLAGKGDMLYEPNGEERRRVQGVFVSNDEINAVIEFVKTQGGTADYSNDVMNKIENAGTAAGSVEDDGDELLPEVIELVVQSGQASASMLQRRFRIGYNRAARIIDMLEARGIIGPPDGSRPRQVLMTETELYAMKSEVTNAESGEE